MHTLLIKNAFVVNKGKIQKKSVLIEDEKIKHIAENIKHDADEIIEAEGKYLLPGFIDTHVHFREPGLTHKADFQTESRAAVAGGVTTFFDMPNTVPQTVSLELIEQKKHLASKVSLANYAFFIGATKKNIDLISNIPSGTIAGIKLFFASSTGDMLVNEPDTVSRLFRSAQLPIVVHSEDQNIINRNTKFYKQKYGDEIPAAFHKDIRSAEACLSATKQLTELALKHHTKLHFLHISTRGEVDFLRTVKNPAITFEITPNHLFFSDKDYKKSGTKIKINPAIKTETDRQALIEAVANADAFTVASDHAPHLLAEKEQNYWLSPSGMPSVQHNLFILLELHRQKIISLETIAKLTAHNPAKLFGIKGRGFIEEGYFADLVIVDTQSITQVKKDNLFYKCKWSPLEGYKFHSKILKTIVNGKIVYDNGKINGGNIGKAVEFL